MALYAWAVLRASFILGDASEGTTRALDGLARALFDSVQRLAPHPDAVRPHQLCQLFQAHQVRPLAPAQGVRGWEGQSMREPHQLCQLLDAWAEGILEQRELGVGGRGEKAFVSSPARLRVTSSWTPGLPPPLSSRCPGARVPPASNAPCVTILFRWRMRPRWAFSRGASCRAASCWLQQRRRGTTTCMGWPRPRLRTRTPCRWAGLRKGGITFDTLLDGGDRGRGVVQRSCGTCTIKPHVLGFASSHMLSRPHPHPPLSHTHACTPTQVLQELVRALRVAGFRAARVLQPCGSSSSTSPAPTAASPLPPPAAARDAGWGSGGWGGVSHGSSGSSRRGSGVSGALPTSGGARAMGPFLVDVLVPHPSCVHGVALELSTEGEYMVGGPICACALPHVRTARLRVTAGLRRRHSHTRARAHRHANAHPIPHARWVPLRPPGAAGTA